MTSGTKSSLTDLQTIAGEAFAALRAGRQVSPFSERFPGFDLEGAYQLATLVERMRGKPRRIANGSQDWVYQSDHLGGTRRLCTDLGICLRPYRARPK